MIKVGHAGIANSTRAEGMEVRILKGERGRL